MVSSRIKSRNERRECKHTNKTESCEQKKKKEREEEAGKKRRCRRGRLTELYDRVMENSKRRAAR